MSRWVVIAEGRQLADHLTEYQLASKRTYRWRWVAWLMHPNGTRLMYDEEGRWWLLRWRIERVTP